MAVFHPRIGIDEEQVAFLEEMRQIQRNGIAHLSPAMTGAEVANYYFHTYQEKGITPLFDERHNVGHTIHTGLKREAHRLFLSIENTESIGEHIYTIEPGGVRSKKQGRAL